MAIAIVLADGGLVGQIQSQRRLKNAGFLYLYVFLGAYVLGEACSTLGKYCRITTGEQVSRCSTLYLYKYTLRSSDPFIFLKHTEMRYAWGGEEERGECCMYRIVMSSFLSRVMHIRIVLERNSTLELPLIYSISKHVLCLEILELFLNGRLKC